MSDEKKRYVHWYTDMKQPLDLTGWEWQRQFGFAAWDDGKELVAGQHYRKFMTDAEAHVFFVLQTCDVVCPEGSRIVDFRPPALGEMIIGQFGPAIYDGGPAKTNKPEFILEKIPEINWVEPTDQDAVELKRPAVRFRDDKNLPRITGGHLVAVDSSESFGAAFMIKYKGKSGDYFIKPFVYCEMDASL